MSENFKIVPAGAGAGKTHRIQTQLTDWIKSGTVRAERIMAVTFTDAAANELRERIRSGLLSEGLIDAALAVEHAYVSTIHGLGLRILTEHAFAFSSSPSPRHLSDVERDLLIRQELSRCIELNPIKNDLARFGYSPSFGTDQSVEDVFRSKVFNVIDLLRSLGDFGESTALASTATKRLRDLYGETDADGHALERHLYNAATSMMSSFPEGALNVSGLKPTAVGKFRKDLANLRRVTREPNVLSRDWKLWNSLRDLRQTKRGSPTPDGYDEAADIVMSAANGLLRHPAPLAEAVLHLECLIHGCQAIMARYAEKKRELGVIDFSDMISSSERLLRTSPEVMDAILSEIDCVIVDEFQDTNPVQFALLWKLASRAPRTLLVGDVKQSIMGFQGADPRLTAALIDKFESRVDPLNQNWRSDPRIMDFVNTFGRSLFGDSYTDLTPTRPRTGQTCLEIVHVVEGRSSRKSHPEQHIAARISAILDAKENVIDRQSGEPRAVKPSDIAILCYSHKRASLYSEALKCLGLPVLISATGWISSEVVTAARFALAFAANPKDSHAALCFLTLGPKRIPLSEALMNLADGKLLERDELLPLRQIQDLANSSPVSTLLSRMLDKAGFWDWAKTLPDSAQALSDLKKLEFEAQDFEVAHSDMKAAAGFHGYSAEVFLGWLSSRQNERDFDRHPDPSSGSARGIEIVTWHASKGREWPIVVVAELDRDIGERPGSISAEFGDFSDLDNVINTARIIYTPEFAAKEKTSLFIDDRRKAAEEGARNLLYVALTRARDRLIIEWPEFSLKGRGEDAIANSYAALFADECSITIKDGAVILGGEEFPAKVLFAPKESPRGFESESPPSQAPYLQFGVHNELAPSTERTPWRERPSQYVANDQVTGPIIQMELGIPLGAIPEAFSSATDKGTALHLAFRTLATHPDMKARLFLATGLGKETLDAIETQAVEIKQWLVKEGFPTLHFELPIQIIEESGAETNAVIDCLAEGDAGYAIIDHKSGFALSLNDRFSSYWPQLSAYANAVQRIFPNKPVLRLAINWINEGKISFVDM